MIGQRWAVEPQFPMSWVGIWTDRDVWRGAGRPPLGRQQVDVHGVASPAPQADPHSKERFNTAAGRVFGPRGHRGPDVHFQEPVFAFICLHQCPRDVTGGRLCRPGARSAHPAAEGPGSARRASTTR